MIIFRYMAREVTQVMLAIIIVLLCVFMIDFFTNYMNALLEGQITFASLFKIIAMQVPLLAGYLLPLALYLSILIVYARFCMQNEMVVLQAGGFSRLKIYAYTLGFSSVVVLLVLVLMLYIEPVMQKYRLELKAAAFAEATIAKITPQRFIPLQGQQGTFYAQQSTNFHQRLERVFWARQLPLQPGQKHPGWDVVTARWAGEATLPGIIDHFLVFHNGYEYVGYPGQKDFKISSFANYGVRLSSKVGSLPNPIKFASTASLFKMQQHDNDARAELQWRLAMPISAIILMFIAVCFGQLNPRRGGKFVQLFPAVLLYVLYADLMFVARDKIQSGSWLGNTFGMWWVHGLFVGIALLCMAFDFKIWRKLRVVSNQYALRRRVTKL